MVKDLMLVEERQQLPLFKALTEHLVTALDMASVHETKQLSLF